MKPVLLATVTSAILGAITLYGISTSSRSVNDEPLLSSLRRNLQQTTPATYPWGYSVNQPLTRAPVARAPTMSAPQPSPMTSAPIASAPSSSTMAPVLLTTDAPSSIAASPVSSAPVLSPVASAPTSSSTSTLKFVGNNGYPSSAFPLAKCQGDCDSDNECATGLVCFERTYTTAVPGCTGTPVANHDYCIDPADNVNNQGGAIGGRPTEQSFGLKLFWREGFFWQEEPFDRKWCMKCDDMTAECFAGQTVFSTECITNTTADEATEWQFVYLPSGAFYIKILTSDLCLTLPIGTKRAPLTAEPCSPYNERQLFFAQNGKATFGDKFELHPATAVDKCLSITHHPKFGERIFAWPCDWPRAWTTALWNLFEL